MRPLPSRKGWMHRKSSTASGMRMSGSMRPSRWRRRRRSTRSSMACGVATAGTGVKRTRVTRPSASRSTISLSVAFHRPPSDGR